MSFRYCCPECGTQLNENDVHINLAKLLFAGGDDGLLKSGKKLLISRDKMAKMCGGEARILEELLEIAFPKSYPTFRKKVLQEEANIDAQLAELGRAGETSANESAKNAFDDSKDKEERDREQKRIELKESKRTVASKIPFLDLSEEQRNQLWANHLEEVIVTYDAQCGYKFRYIKNAEAKSGSGSIICPGPEKGPECGAEVLSDAFQKKQYIVGVVGTASVGKTCMIAAMSDYLSECAYLQKGHESRIGENYPIMVQNTPIFIREEQLQKDMDPVSDSSKVSLFKKAMTSYRKGRMYDKNTDKEGKNCVNPTVVRARDMWTFVDVAGEVIKSTNTNKINSDGIQKHFASVLKCDAYLFCVGSDNPMDGAANKAIEDFMKILDKEKKNVPVMLIATKVDNVNADLLNNCIVEATNQGRKTWITSEYNYAAETAYVMRLMSGAYDTLSANNYCTAITSSAFGFVPKDKDGDESESPRPRNIGMIIDWIEMLAGEKEVKKQGRVSVKCNGLKLKRSESHLKNEEVLYISRMFSNPQKSEVEYYKTMNQGLYGWVRRLFIK